MGIITCPECGGDVEEAVNDALDRVAVGTDTRVIVVVCPFCKSPIGVADARGWKLKNKLPLHDKIKEIVRLAGQGDSRISVGDQKIIQYAVCDFVKNYLQPRQNPEAPTVRALSARIETAIKLWGDFRGPHLLVTEDCMKHLCRHLSGWINANYEEKI